MTLRELRMIKNLTGMRAGEFAEASDEMDPDAIAALIYVLHQRDKISVAFEEVDLDFKDFEIEATEQEKKEMAEMEKRAQAAADAAQAPKVHPSGPRKTVASKRK
jgi:CHAT domain-containing protein